jgi:hypothetical protein
MNNSNPQIIKTDIGIELVFEFKILPIDYDGSFYARNIEPHYRTIVYDIQSKNYVLKDNIMPKDNIHHPNKLHVTEDHLYGEKHILIDYKNLHFESIGPYVISAYDGLYNKK